MNITDVGHLTSDADTGEDKMEKGARRTGKTAWEIAQLYTDAFPRATSQLPQHRGRRRSSAARPTTSASRSRSSPTSRRTASRTRRPTACTSTRRSRRTTATSRASTSTGSGGRQARGRRRQAPSRPTSRCGNSRRPARSARWNGTARGAAASRAGTSSARRWRRNTWATTSTSTAAARTTFPVHHTNEIAQTEARVGTRLANFWMHGYFLLMNDAKMAKSAGEFLRVQSLHRARLRSARVPLPVPHRALPDADELLVGGAGRRGDGARPHAQRHLRAARRRRRRRPTRRYLERFTDEINDDLNVPRALAVAWEVLRGDLPPAVKRATLLRFDDVLGLGLAQWQPQQDDVPPEVAGAGRGPRRRAQGEAVGGGRPPAGGTGRRRLGDGRPARRLPAQKR